VDSVHLPRRLLLAGLGSAAVAATTACTSSGATSTTRRPGPSAVRQSSGASGNEAALRRKISSLLVVGFRGERVKEDDWIIRAVNAGLGGVILFDQDLATKAARNIRSPAQVTALVKTLRDASPGRLIVSIDQEGGRTSRLNPSSGFPATKSEAEVGAENSPSGTREWAPGLVVSLTQIGVDLNYAPVVDLNVNPESWAIGRLGRSFSANPDIVVSNATQEIQIHRAAGVKTVLKHVPGSGRASGNTDFEVVNVSNSWNRTELEPFQRLIQAGLADSIISAHVHNKQLDPKFPASLSTSSSSPTSRSTTRRSSSRRSTPS
jgi:beta-N-acetylhexosaminidase